MRYPSHVAETIDALRNCYLGGYVHDGDEPQLEAFRHGMATAVQAAAQGRDHRASKLRAAEAEVERLKGRLRTTAQILIAKVGADGPMDAEDAAARAVRLIDKLRAP